MANIVRRPEWFIPKRLITPESVFLNRRYFLSQIGLASAGVMALPLAGCSSEEATKQSSVVASQEKTNSPLAAALSKKYPAPRNPEFNPGWRLTAETIAGSYNNFYEFSLAKDKVRKLVDKFVTSPWPIEITGLVEKPITIDAQELVDMMPLEERVYRFRCVEAWAMIVPWTGFPLSKLIEKVSPKPEAKFVRFITFNRPEQAPGMTRTNYPWPYFEGLRMDEAMHPLTLVTTGIYGKPLPKQHGAPIRLVVPWKYGYKSIKSIVKMEFVNQQPTTFWETLAPDEYPFESNVDPKVPHPRWSQATEEVLGTGDRVRTQAYNGYGNYVAKLYAKG